MCSLFFQHLLLFPKQISTSLIFPTLSSEHASTRERLGIGHVILPLRQGCIGSEVAKLLEDSWVQGTFCVPAKTNSVHSVIPIGVWAHRLHLKALSVQCLETFLYCFLNAQCHGYNR
jgi:hypothetical protein